MTATLPWDMARNALAEIDLFHFISSIGGLLCIAALPATLHAGVPNTKVLSQFKGSPTDVTFVEIGRPETGLHSVMRAQLQPRPAPAMDEKQFDFKYFESLQAGERVAEAQREAERLFPPGSNAESFKSYFTASGAKCIQTSDSLGPAIGCIYTKSGLSLVTTSWTVVGRLDPTLTKITSVLMNRYLTGM